MLLLCLTVETDILVKSYIINREKQTEAIQPLSVCVLNHIIIRIEFFLLI